MKDNEARIQELATDLREAALAHHKYEVEKGSPDADWEDWYAAFIARREMFRAGPLPAEPSKGPVDMNGVRDKITAEIFQAGYQATHEYPGFIRVKISKNLWMDFGTANGTWEGDLTLSDHAIAHARLIPAILATEVDASLVAGAIIKFVQEDLGL